MLDTNECNIILQFLDRVAITGHNERQAMNMITKKLQDTVKADTEINEISKDNQE